MIEFRQGRLDSGDGAELNAAYRIAIAEMYDGLDIDGSHMPAAGVAELHPPQGAFLIGYDDDGRPVCCGGLKDLHDGAIEIKRMYVAPEARGRGVARQLLGALEEQALAMGFKTVRLDTGPRQLDARHLYETAGYVEIGNYNDNPVAVYFAEKRLVP